MRNLLHTVKGIGGLPSGYTAVSCLQSSGTQLINTGIYLQEGDKIILEWEYQAGGEGDKFILGTKNSNTSLGGCWLETYGSSDTWYVRFSSPSSVNKPSTASQLTGKHLLELYQGHFDIDGEEFLTPGYQGTFQNEPLTVFGRYDATGTGYKCCYSKIYSFKVTNNGELRLNLIPCRRNSDNVLGMYDLQGRQFLTNIGSGSFTEG